MNGLKIIVCIKLVPDPEGPPNAFKVDPDAKKMTAVGLPPVISPFDENALEVALQLKEKHGGSVTAVSMGRKLAKPVLKKALGVGADDLIILEDERFNNELDSYSTAYVLSSALEKIGAYDLIFAGRQASDWNSGQVGIILAEILKIPSISLAQKVSVEGSKVFVERLKRNGYEIVETSMPALITVDSQVGDLRYPPLQALIAARKRPLTQWGIAELEMDPGKLEDKRILSFSPPPSRERSCFLIKSESPEENAEILVNKLQEDKAI